MWLCVFAEISRLQDLVSGQVSVPRNEQAWTFHPQNTNVELPDCLLQLFAAGICLKRKVSAAGIRCRALPQVCSLVHILKGELPRACAVSSELGEINIDVSLIGVSRWNDFSNASHCAF